MIHSPSQHQRSRRTAALVLALSTVTLSVAACSTSDPSPAPSAPSAASSSAVAPASTPPVATPSTAASSPAATSSTAPTSQPFGPACSEVPSTGAGSFDGMSTSGVATAASNNPLLSTLVTAVKRAGLVDTLNNTPDITVFAPDNDAFAAVSRSDLTKLLANRSQLTDTLTTHVVKGRLAPDQLAGEHQTLSGSTITVTGSGEDFTVDGNAHVVCGNIQTSNATVYVIDHVLSPS